MAKRVILSGMRPTGRLHLGNWMGALSNWVNLSQDPNTECFFMVADWHALTTDYETPEQIESNVQEMVLDWLSAGLDPKRVVLFRQSWVREHAELALILSMLTPLSWLERNPTYKDMVLELENKEIATHGFLGYPVLQAADILLYSATHVPVGEDQLPHLELTREIARRFNHIYGRTVLNEPAAILTQAKRVPGLDGRKMSKSYQNTIDLAEESELLKKKINRMFTDPLKIRSTDPGHPRPSAENPTGCVVYALHEIYEKDSAALAQRASDCASGALGCVPCKKALHDAMDAEFQPRRQMRQSLVHSAAEVNKILEEGSVRASQRARRVYENVLDAIGFRAFPKEKFHG